MKSLLGLLALTTAMTVPVLAQAKPVTITTNLTNYGGPNAFLAYYVTDASGKYVGSLWMAGDRARYYRHLGGWVRTSGGDMAGIAGITGASVGSGRRLTLTVDLADSIFDAGYVLHVDAAAENVMESPNEIQIPLTTAGAGKPVSGTNFIADLTYSM